MPRARTSGVSYPKLVGPSDADLTLMLNSFEENLAGYFEKFEAKQRKNQEELRKFIDKEIAINDHKNRKILETLHRRATDSVAQLKRLQRTLSIRNQLLIVKREQERTDLVEEAARIRKVGMCWVRPSIITTPLQEEIARNQTDKIDDRSADVLALEHAFGGGFDEWG